MTGIKQNGWKKVLAVFLSLLFVASVVFPVLSEDAAAIAETAVTGITLTQDGVALTERETILPETELALTYQLIFPAQAAVDWKVKLPEGLIAKTVTLSDNRFAAELTENGAGITLTKEAEAASSAASSEAASSTASSEAASSAASSEAASSAASSEAESSTASSEAASSAASSEATSSTASSEAESSAASSEAESSAASSEAAPSESSAEEPVIVVESAIVTDGEGGSSTAETSSASSAETSSASSSETSSASSSETGPIAESSSESSAAEETGASSSDAERIEPPVTLAVEMTVLCGVNWENKPSRMIAVAGKEYTLFNGAFRRTREAAPNLITATPLNASFGELGTTLLEVKYDSATRQISSPLWIRYKYTLPDGYVIPADKNNTLTIGLPSQFTVASDFENKLIDSGFNSTIPAVTIAAGNSGKLVLTFNTEYLKRQDRHGYFEVLGTFQPKDATTGSETITHTGNCQTAPTIHFNKVEVLPTITKTREDPKTGHENSYKWTVTLIPGNSVKTPVTLTETLTDLVLDETKDVTFNNVKLTKDATDAKAADYTYADNKLTYTTAALSGLEPFKSYELVYYTTVNSAIYLQAKPATVSSISTGAYDPSGRIEALDAASVTASSFVITPRLIDKTYKVEGSGTTKWLEWTVTINGNSLEMSEADFYIGTGDSEKTYLEKAINIKVDNKDIPADGWTEETPFSDAKYNYKMSNSLAEGVRGVNDNISKPMTITFRTDITQEFFKTNRDNYTFNVDVGLEWWFYPEGSGDGYGSKEIIGGSWEDQLHQPTPPKSALVAKTFDTYDPATGIVTWTITVNENQMNLTNPVTLTDTLKEGQTLVSVSVGGTEITKPEVDASNAFTITLDDIKTATKTVTVKTKVAPDDAFRNGKATVSNSLKMESTDITTTTTGASGSIANDILKKAVAKDYDPATRTITWKLTVNASKKPMTGATITDTVSDVVVGENSLGHIMVDEEIQCKDEKGATVTLTPSKFTEGSDVGGNKVYTLALGDQANGKTLVLTYKTKLSEDAPFNVVGGTANAENKASISYTSEGAGRTAETAPVTAPVTIDAITKQMESDVVGGGATVNNYIKNTIEVNKEYLTLSNASITDKMDVTKNGGGSVTPLTIDPSSMKLVGYTSDKPTTPVEITVKLGTDNPSAVGEAVLVKSAFEPKSGFKLLLPQSTNYRYVLTYYAKVNTRENRALTVNNKATYVNNTQTLEANASASITLSNGSAFSKDDSSVNGSITIINKDSDTTNYSDVCVKDTTYALYDSVVGKEIASGKTDANGTLTFSGLASGRDYYLKEILPGLGYVANTTDFKENGAGLIGVKKITIDPSADKIINVTETILSQIVMVGIPTFDKTNEDEYLNEKEVTFDLMLKGKTDAVKTVTVTPNTAKNTVDFTATDNDKVRFSTDGYTIVETATGFKDVSIKVNMSDNRKKDSPYNTTDVTLSGGGITGTLGNYTLENKRLTAKASVKLTGQLTKDSEPVTGLTLPSVAGARFTLTVTGVGIAGSTVETKTINASNNVGYINFTTDIKHGQKYEIEQTAEPTNYETNGNKIKDCTGTYEGKAIPQATQINEYNGGVLTVKKVDDSATLKPLAGAKFTCNGQNKTTPANGTIYYLLPAGTYPLTETDSPDGYMAATGQVGTQDVAIAGASATTERFKDVTVKNEKIFTDLSFTKKAGILKSDGTVDNDHPTPYKGATFTFTDGDGTKHTATSDENGLVKFTDVPIGSYTIVETPVDSFETGEPITVTVSQKTTFPFGLGETRWTENANYKDGVYTNKRVSSKITVNLEGILEGTTPAEGDGTPDYDNKSVNGATFGIFTDQECTKPVSEQKEFTGKVLEFVDLPKGTYYVKQLTVADGFAPAPVKSVEITASNTAPTLTFTNQREFGTLVITMTDSKDKTVKLPNAKVTITKKDGGTIAPIKPEQTTIAGGTITIPHCPYGDYIVTLDPNEFNTSTPPKPTTRYLPDKFSPISVKIGKPDPTNVAVMATKLLDAKITVVSKDKWNDTPIAGAKITLSVRPTVIPPVPPVPPDPSIPPVPFTLVEEKTTDIDGKTEFTQLIAGNTYEVKEIFIPNGYLLDYKVELVDATDKSSGEIGTYKFLSEKPTNGGGGGGGTISNKPPLTPKPDVPKAETPLPTPPAAIIDQVEHTTGGETITVELDPEKDVPADVIGSIVGKDVTLVINIGGETITLNGNSMPALDQNKKFYSVFELRALGAYVKNNPSTGGGIRPAQGKPAGHSGEPIDQNVAVPVVPGSFADNQPAGTTLAFGGILAASAVFCIAWLKRKKQK